MDELAAVAAKGLQPLPVGTASGYGLPSIFVVTYSPGLGNLTLNRSVVGQ